MTINYQAILDLAASAGWSWEIRDEWLYFIRPHKEDYGSWRVYPRGDERNVETIARTLAAYMGDALLNDLGLGTKLELLNVVAQRNAIIITPDPESGYHAEIPALKGCMAFGDTPEDALATLLDVKDAWLEIAKERGWEIPAGVKSE